MSVQKLQQATQTNTGASTKENVMKKTGIHLSAVIGLVVALTGCQEPEQQAQSAPPAAPPVGVKVMTVQTDDIPVYFEYVGQIAGSKEVEVRSRITGIIENRLYEEGSQIKEGQLLFQIEQAPFKAMLAKAEAAVASAQAQTTSAEAQLNKANKEYWRIIPLAKKKLVSRSIRDDAASDVEIAKAQVLIAKAAVKEAEANLTTVEIDLDYTQVKSPIDGIAGRALKTHGALVEAGSNSLMTTLVQVDPAYVNFGVAESEQIRMRSDIAEGKLVLPKEGFRVELLNSDGSLLGYKGALDFQDYKVDNATGNFAMRATIANPDNTLSPGQFVRVRLSGAKRPAAIAVPQRAVLDDAGGKYVYVAGKGEGGSEVAERKSVSVGEWIKLDGELTNGWIINDGLIAGDNVIIDGSARIFFPGMPVKSQTQADVESVSADKS